MPPVLDEAKENVEILEKDEMLSGFSSSKHLFIDISLGLPIRVKRRFDFEFESNVLFAFRIVWSSRETSMERCERRRWTNNDEWDKSIFPLLDENLSCRRCSKKTIWRFDIAAIRLSNFDFFSDRKFSNVAITKSFSIAPAFNSNRTTPITSG